MSTLKGSFIFPPVHDFSMPYLAGPLLKGYIESRTNDISIKCIDLNLKFFKLAINNYGNLLTDYRSGISSNSIITSVDAALDYKQKALSLLQDYSNKYSGHRWTLRNYKAPENRENPADLFMYSTKDSPYDNLFNETIESIKTDDFVLVNLTVEDQLLAVFRLMRLIRESNQNLPIILGGNLVNRICRFFSVIELAQFCDYIVLREGEYPLYELLSYLKDGNRGMNISDPRILNLEKIVKFPTLDDFIDLPKKHHTNLLDNFIPDFSDLEVDQYFSPKATLPILMSRKCYWGRCEFCNIHAAWDPSHRRRTSSDVYNEICMNIKHYNINSFRIVDEASPPDMLQDISKYVIAGDIDISYQAYAILEKRFTDLQLIRDISVAGCQQLFFGLESKSKKIIKLMGKEINRTSQLPELFKNTANNGIHNYTFTMFGFPGEDTVEQDKTVNYVINDKNIHTAVVANYVAEYGSPLTRRTPDKFTHSGNISEKLQFINESRSAVDLNSIGKENAVNAQKLIFQKRPDLALNSILSDEDRMFLTKMHSPDYALYYCSSTKYHKFNVQAAITSAIEQRIKRKLY